VGAVAVFFILLGMRDKPSPSDEGRAPADTLELELTLPVSMVGEELRATFYTPEAASQERVK